MVAPAGWRQIREFYDWPEERVLIRDNFIILPHGWEEVHLVTLDLPDAVLLYGRIPIRRMLVHRLVYSSLVGIFDTLCALGNWKLIKTYEGCFCPRLKRRGGTYPSMHAMAAALDFNALTCPMGEKGSQPTVLVELFQSNGWTWGGDFGKQMDGRQDMRQSDPMHFQFGSGY